MVSLRVDPSTWHWYDVLRGHLENNCISNARGASLGKTRQWHIRSNYSPTWMNSYSLVNQWSYLLQSRLFEESTMTSSQLGYHQRIHKSLLQNPPTRASGKFDHQYIHPSNNSSPWILHGMLLYVDIIIFCARKLLTHTNWIYCTLITKISIH